jgi:hypothetical protein
VGIPEWPGSNARVRLVANPPKFSAPSRDAGFSETRCFGGYPSATGSRGLDFHGVEIKGHSQGNLIRGRRAGGWGNFRAAIVNQPRVLAPARSGRELKSMQILSPVAG